MQRHGDEPLWSGAGVRDSLNTWFAWLMETSDATLLDDPAAPGLAGVRTLTPDALRGRAALLDMAAGLGFGADQDLDGGLLPAGMIETGDALRTTAFHAGPDHQPAPRFGWRRWAFGCRLRRCNWPRSRRLSPLAIGQRPDCWRS